MGKYQICLIIVFITSGIYSQAQMAYNENVVCDNAWEVKDVTHSDIDGDGDEDIIVINSHDFAADSIYWFRNLDGLGTYGPRNFISAQINEVRSVVANDIDEDGNMDIAVVSYVYPCVFWQKNLDGEGTFGPVIIIDTEMEAPRQITFGDIDNDGHDDILLACGSHITVHIDLRLIWYKNNGSGDFTKFILSTDKDATCVSLCDLDGDDDLDIAAGDFFNGSAYWYENLDGLGTFGSPNQFSSIGCITSIDNADFDNDNDMDLVLSSSNGINIAWIENTDNQGTFLQHDIEGYNTTHCIKILASDFNNDGYIDIVSIINNSKIVLYENLFGYFDSNAKQNVNENISDIMDIDKCDINADGKFDIIASAYTGAFQLAWYENLGLVANKIYGDVTLDADVNGCDSNDMRVPDLMVLLDDGVESRATFTLDNGYYQFYTQEGNYTVSLNSPLLNYYTTDPTNYNFSFAGIGETVKGDFCLEPIPGYNDLNISAYPLCNAVPGFTLHYLVRYQNGGPTILSDSVIFDFDGNKLNFLNSSEPVSNQTENSLIFYYNELYPLESRSIRINFEVFTPPIVNSGDTLHFTASVLPIEGDVTEEDNIISIDQIVVASLDPNDIQVVEGQTVLIDDIDKYLHYIIRFQNTGNFYAKFIRITNELSDKLDWNTFQVEKSSHSNYVEITDGNKVSFFFDAIYLPDSNTNEPGSHGYITYKIKPGSDIVSGNIISNQASIIFDYNTPISTNIVNTEIVDYLKIHEEDLLEFSILPIPTEDYILVKSRSQIIKVNIYNSLGQMVMEYNEGNIFDVSNLLKGVYIVEVYDIHGKSNFKKIIKI